MYCDNFIMEGLITVTLVDAPGQTPPFKTEVEINWRFNKLKSIMLLQKVV